MVADTCRSAKDYWDCLHKAHSIPPKWTPWPMSNRAWQQVHADYCTPFLHKNHALITINSYLNWPEVLFTTSPNEKFTMHAVQKLSIRAGVPPVLMRNDGTHFTDVLAKWINSIGFKHLFTFIRHPCSNGQWKNFVKTLSSTMNV